MKIVTVLLLLFISTQSNTQGWDWGIDAIGTKYSGAGLSFPQIDSFGNSYIINGSQTFIKSTNNDSFSFNKGFTLIKLNRNGKRMWNKNFIAPHLKMFKLTQSNELCIILSCPNSVSNSYTFANRTINNSNSSPVNYYLIKFDNNGNELDLIKLFSSSTSDGQIYYFDVRDNNLIMDFKRSLRSSDSIVFKNISFLPKVNYYFSDHLIISLNLKTSEVIWEKSDGYYGSTSVYLQNAYLDKNSIYLNSNFIQNKYSQFPTLYKLDYSGKIIIAKTFQGTKPSYRSLRTITKSKSNEIIVGLQMSDTTIIDNNIIPVKMGTKNYALVCLDSNLNYKWHWMAKCDYSQSATNSAIDNLGNIYISLTVWDTVIIGANVINADVSMNICQNPIIKLDSKGKHVETINFEGNTSLWFESLNTDNMLNFYVLGTYVDFNNQNPRSSVVFGDFRFEVPLDQQANQGIFLAKYNNHKLRIANKKLWCKTDSLMSDADSIYKFFKWVIDDSLTFWGKNVSPKFSQTGKHKVVLFGYEVDSIQSRKTDTFYFYSPVSAKIDYPPIACRFNPTLFRDISIIDKLPNTGVIAKIQFGDGLDTVINTTLSQLRNLQNNHIYKDTGEFFISYVLNYTFCSDTFLSKIKVIDAPNPGFDVNINIGCAPLKVITTNNFVGICNNILWSFGNKQILQDDSLYLNKKIEFVFDTPGNFIIKQQLFAPSGCVSEISKSITVLDGFSAGNDSVTINYSSVSNPNEITLNWNKVNKAKFYEVSDGINSLFTRDTNVTLTNYLTSKSSYTFFINAVDTCGKILKSNIGKTILLTGFSDTMNKFSVINWTPYERWPSGVLEYTIEYLNNQTNTFDDVSTSQLNIYHDNNFLDLNNSLNEKCYRIVGYQRLGSNISTSNIICLQYKPTIFIPNSFTPNGDGLNDKFEIISMGLKEIKVQIFNRWGILLFETTDEKLYWDGFYQNSLVPIGIYTVLVSAKSSLKSIQYSSTISLLR